MSKKMQFNIVDFKRDIEQMAIAYDKEVAAIKAKQETKQEVRHKPYSSMTEREWGELWDGYAAD